MKRERKMISSHVREGIESYLKGRKRKSKSRRNISALLAGWNNIEESICSRSFPSRLEGTDETKDSNYWHEPIGMKFIWWDEKGNNIRLQTQFEEYQPTYLPTNTIDDSYTEWNRIKRSKIHSWSNTQNILIIGIHGK